MTDLDADSGRDQGTLAVSPLRAAPVRREIGRRSYGA